MISVRSLTRPLFTRTKLISSAQLIAVPLQLSLTRLLALPQELSDASRRFSTTTIRGHSLERRNNSKFRDQAQIPISELIPRCQGCGTPFQEDRPGHLGFKKDEAQDTKLSFQTQNMAQHHRLYSKLDETAKVIYSASVLQGQDAEILQNDESTELGHAKSSSETLAVTQDMPKLEIEHFHTGIFDRHINQQFKNERKELINSGLCLTCRDRKGGRYVDLSDEHHPSTEDVISRIPPTGSIVHVISAQDFPASYIEGVEKLSGNRKVIYVITKSDLAVDEQFKVRQRFAPYALQELEKINPKINPANVFFTSAKLKWGLRDLYSSLPGDAYLLGLPNSGKSALAHALGALSKDHVKPKLSIEIKQRTYSQSHIPLTTKFPLSYINGDKRITDLPAVHAERLAIYNYVIPKKLKAIVDGNVLIQRMGRPATVRVVLTRNDNVLSLGGLVFVRMDNAPPGVHLIFWCPSGLHHTINRKFASLESGFRNSAVQTRTNEEWFVNEPFDLENPDAVAVNEVTEVMSASIGRSGSDFAILGYGPLLVQVSGPVPKEGVKITFFAKKGVEIRERSPIIYHMRDFRLTDRQTKMKEQKRSGSARHDTTHAARR